MSVLLGQCCNKRTCRQESKDGGLALSKGTNERPSTKSGMLAPARVAKVGARSTLATISETVWPAGTPGPITYRGTRISSS